MAEEGKPKQTILNRIVWRRKLRKILFFGGEKRKTSADRQELSSCHVANLALTPSR